MSKWCSQFTVSVLRDEIRMFFKETCKSCFTNERGKPAKFADPCSSRDLM